MKIAAVPTLVLTLAALCSSVDAASLTSSSLGCKTQADATKAAMLRAKKDSAGLDAFSKPLIAARSCIAFAKGVTIDVDEKRPPLACVRLTGDLECYWVADALVDLYPSAEKGGAAGHRGGGGSRRH